MISSDAADTFAAERMRMVRTQLEPRGITDPAVLEAMLSVPRHLFVPPEERGEAYSDGPLAIGYGQTISQPYIVASMTQELRVGVGSRVLEIGTGCGYQTAVLAEIGCEVYSVEIVPELYERASGLLGELRYSKIRFRLGDGFRGWSEFAPFDGIIVTAAAPELPETYELQLCTGGRIIIPLEHVVTGRQSLYRFQKSGSGLEKTWLYDVRFVRMTGDSPV